MLLNLIIISVLISMGLVLFRVIIGPSVFDRIMAANSFGTNLVVFIVLFGLFENTEYLIDIAMIYAMVNFVSTVAFLMYFKYSPKE